MENNGGGRLELLIGISITLFAAMLAINDLGAGRYGDDEMISHNLSGKMYSWYQSKSIKQTLREGEAKQLIAFKEVGLISEEKHEKIDSLVKTAQKEIDRYEKEKAEILNGSAHVGKENWVIKQDGEFGKVIGAEEYEANADALGGAGDKFDLATLFLQLSLVIGAIGLIMKGEKRKKFFMLSMIALGAVGVLFSVQAYWIAMSI